MKLGNMQLNVSLTGLSVKSRKKRKGNYANIPDKRGSGLWMKPAFDLVIAREGCIYGVKHNVTNDKKIEGHNQAKEVKICNGCIFLDWDDGYICTGEVQVEE